MSRKKPLPILNRDVTGNDMLQVQAAINRLEGGVSNTAQRLAVSWTAEEIVRSSGRTPGCLCPVLEASIFVNPEVAYNLARKSPQRTAAEQGVTHIAANYGGVIPLYALGKVLGPWDSLLEEVVPRRRG